MRPMILSILCFLLASQSFSQQFILKWEASVPQYLSFVGDVDGDGVGEFINTFVSGDSLNFYDGATGAVERTIYLNGLYPTLFAGDPLDVGGPARVASLGYVDFNDNGSVDLPYYDYATNRLAILDSQTDEVIFDYSAINAGIAWLSLNDFDGDGELDVLIRVGGTLFRAYSTGVLVTDAKHETNNPLLPQPTLSTNYPNPFNPSTRIEFYLPIKAHVDLSVFDIRGSKIKTLIGESKSAGSYSVEWDGTNDVGATVATGAYFYQLRIDGQTLANKMLLTK